MSWDTSPKTGLFYVLLTSKGGNIAVCCALVLATKRKQQTLQLWMEGTVEGCGFFCSPKLPCLSTMSQQFCRRLLLLRVLHLWRSSWPLLSFQLKLQALIFQTKKICFILGTTAPKLIKFLFFTSFLEPVNGGGLFVPLPIGQASWESNLPKAKNYLSLTIGRDFFRSLAFTFSSLTPTEQTYGQIEK